MEENAIKALVTRLARPHREGGHTVERAAILAEGSDSAAIEAWILAHAGRLERARQPSPGGLHGSPSDNPGEPSRRFILPPSAL